MTDTQKIYQKAIETFGWDMQIQIAIEEMAELTKELCKAQRMMLAAKRGIAYPLTDNNAAITEEIADVQIVIEELIWMFGVPEEDVQEVRKRKLTRLEIRADKGREARNLMLKLDAAHDKLPANYRKVTVGPGPDPAGAKGPWGICPKCGAVGHCYWDKETDTCTCMACGYKD